MIKKILFFIAICLMFQCDEYVSWQKAKASNQQIDTLTRSKSILSDSLPTENVEYSEVNWNIYLKKNDFEQGASDSSLLVLVKPDYAIFVFAQEDMESGDLIAYDVKSFYKFNSSWIEYTNEQINDLEIGNYSKNKWRLEDINGDGFKDILLKVYHDGKQNKRYICYLQKPEQKRFIKLNWFSKMINPEFNAKNKTLETANTHSKGKTEKSYQWVNDSLKFVKGQRYGEIEDTFFEDKEDN